MRQRGPRDEYEGACDDARKERTEEREHHRKCAEDSQRGSDEDAPRPEPLTACCNATTTFVEGEHVCKGCYETVPL